ncbi:MAG TPA: SLC13 family permease [Candidatus Competibacteraceae bacterium]|nr:SLC13 family permease [Candidatus Competibacteraceae bacterium]
MALVLTVFVLVYAGMALGRFPGLQLDRTGIALLGALLLYLGGAVAGEQAWRAIDFPTLFILFGLMLLSAQFAASGFYDVCALRIARAQGSPLRLLAITVAVAGNLAAVLANDVVVFAMTPLLCSGLQARGLDPRPYLIALAGAANAGSAATMIGNPQNILIAQVGRLEFWPFLAACGVPALAGMACVFAVVAWVWRGRFHLGEATTAPLSVTLDRWQLRKALLATVVLLVLFATPLPHESGVLMVAGALLVSRRLASRRMLGMVDWHLLILFAGLFVVTDALAATGLSARLVQWLAGHGLSPERLLALAPFTLVGSNTIGNVPMIMLVLSVWPELGSGSYYALAILSTLAGNLLLIGSLANIIVVERAREAGVRLGFVEHARCGIPMTLLSMALALAWLWGSGLLAL